MKKEAIDPGKYILSGEFAKMMKVTKDTLFHYDKIGLFSPEIKLSNDYRYYSIYQVELFDVILMLKEFGMTLEEIKKILSHRDEEVLGQLFEEQQRRIDEKIQRMKNQRRWLKHLTEHISNLKNVDFDHVGTEFRKKCYYVMAQSKSGKPKELYQKVSELKEQYQHKNQPVGYEIAFLQYAENVCHKVYDNYQDVLLLMEEKPKGMKYHVLPEGEYLIAYHRGHWDSIGEAYERMHEYAEQEHLELEEDYIEVYMIDRLLVDDFDQYVTKIFVRCK